MKQSLPSNALSLSSTAPRASSSAIEGLAIFEPRLLTARSSTSVWPAFASKLNSSLSAGVSSAPQKLTGSESAFVARDS